MRKRAKTEKKQSSLFIEDSRVLEKSICETSSFLTIQFDLQPRNHHK